MIQLAWRSSEQSISMIENEIHIGQVPTNKIFNIFLELVKKNLRFDLIERSMKNGIDISIFFFFLYNYGQSFASILHTYSPYIWHRLCTEICCLKHLLSINDKHGLLFCLSVLLLTYVMYSFLRTIYRQIHHLDKKKLIHVFVGDGLCFKSWMKQIHMSVNKINIIEN